MLLSFQIWIQISHLPWVILTQLWTTLPRYQLHKVKFDMFAYFGFRHPRYSLPNTLNKYGRRWTCHTLNTLFLFFVALKSWPQWKWRLEIFTLLHWTNFRVAYTRLLAALVSDQRSQHSGWEPSPFNRVGQVSSLIPWGNLDARQMF